MDDQRTVFRLDQDKQVVVLLEWQGLPGVHRLVATWKNPSGSAALSSSMEQRSGGGRVSGYWTLILSEKMATGLWVLDVQIDGEPLGVHAIELQSNGATPAGSPAPRILTSAQAYAAAVQSTVTVEALDATNRPSARQAGFMIGPEAVVTAFHGIDGASGVRVTFQNGRKAVTQELLGWHRWQDWAVLKVDAADAPALPRAREAAAVGERCYSLDAATDDSSWLLVETNIIGSGDRGRAGERLSLSQPVSAVGAGAPLLNDRGEVVAIAGTDSMPGRAAQGARVISQSLSVRVQLATPIGLVRLTQPVTSFADLSRRGEFLPPLTAARHVFQGSFGRKGPPAGPATSLVDQGSDFSKRDGPIILWLMWSPTMRLKTTYAIRIYDLDNKILAESAPAKFDLNPGPYSYTYWPLEIGRLPAGILRVDALVGNEPAWRGLLSIKD